MTREEFLKTFPELVKNYQPAPEALRRINEVTLLILIGPSGVGKSTIIDQLDLTFVPSDTTRPKRPGEEEGIDFFFRTDYKQVIDDVEAGRFVQAVTGAVGEFYATRAAAYPESGLAVMPVLADVVPNFRELGFKKTISAFIVPPSYEEWMRRLKSHKITTKQLAKRLNEAKRSLNFALNDHKTHLILNDELEQAVQQIKWLLEGKINIEREKVAREAVKKLLDGIN